MKYSPSPRRASHQDQSEIGKEIFYSFLKSSQICYSCHDWDDFWDFSRMAVPKDNWTVRRRLGGNILKQFTGNYICVWTISMFVTGIMVHRKICFSLIVLVLSWVLLSRINTRGLHRDKPPLSRDEQVRDASNLVNDASFISFWHFGEKIILFIAIAHVALFILQLLWITYVISILIVWVTLIHASLRPVPMEFTRHKVPKVLASDGFMDDKEKEITIVFDQDSDSACSKESSSKSLLKGQIRRRRV